MTKDELALFVIVGSLAVLIGFLTDSGRIWRAAIRVDMAKASGFHIGTVFSYFENRFLTFGHTLGTTVIINAVVLKLLGDAGSVIQVACLAATGIFASRTFPVIKWVVFGATGVADSR